MGLCPIRTNGCRFRNSRLFILLSNGVQGEIPPAGVWGGTPVKNNPALRRNYFLYNYIHYGKLVPFNGKAYLRPAEAHGIHPVGVLLISRSGVLR